MAKDELQIHYEKNPMYRSIHSDGAIGGITPLREFNITFYSTRATIPKSVNYKVNEEGELGKALSFGEDSKHGVIREIEFSVYMNIESAEDLYDFLGKILDKNKK